MTVPFGKMHSTESMIPADSHNSIIQPVPTLPCHLKGASIDASMQTPFKCLVGESNCLKSNEAMC